MSQIFDWLYLGDMQNATNNEWLKANNIQAIINATPDLYECDISRLNVPVKDHPLADIGKYLPLCHTFLCLNRDLNKKVLVHCRMGISRSTTIIIYYLMKEFKIQCIDALNMIRKIRPIVDPNSGFIQLLLKLDFNQI